MGKSIEYILHLCEFEMNECEDDGCCGYEVEPTNKRNADKSIKDGGVHNNHKVHRIYKAYLIDGEVKDDTEIYWKESQD